MRILFVPLALLLLALFSFSFSLEAAKSEDNRGDSVGGMEETPDGEFTGWNNSVNSYERRAVRSPYDFGLKHFKKDNSECKCLRDEYCMKKKSNGRGYEKVEGCGKYNCYKFCEAYGCREVCDKQCKCEFGKCEECSDRGCKHVAKCGYTPIVAWSECKECKQGTGCNTLFEGGGCLFSSLCLQDTVMAADILFEDKCFCKKDNIGLDKDCQMCDKYRCKPVSSCKRFVTCTCDYTDDSYTRCYGFEHGKRECRRVDSCTNANEHERRKKIESLVDPHRGPFGERDGPVKCTCPLYGGMCTMCRYTGFLNKKDVCESAHRHECPAGSIQ